MAIIVNELSLNGQYGTKQDFISSIRTTGIILRCLNLYKVEILKGRDFYSSMITQDCSLYQIFHEKTPDPALQLFKSELLKIIGEPFWEDNQKHTCDDKYKFAHTTLLCQYGLAEATENSKTVISFDHQNYQNNSIELNKNTELITLDNIINLEVLQLKIINFIENGVISSTDDYPDFLPMSKIVKNLKMHDVDNFVSGMSKENKIAIYKSWGKAVALLNFWRVNRAVTSKNDRDVYTRKVAGKQCYITIDTENGTFEYFNHSGNHMGEHNFIGEKTRDDPQTHRITL